MNIVKVRYGDKPDGREYSYYSEDILLIGDQVNAPTARGMVKATVSAINVSESEIEPFKKSVRTIPSKAKIPEIAPIEFDIPDEPPIEVTNPIKLEQDNPGTDIELKSYYQEGLKIRDYAEKRVIKSSEDVKIATDDLAIIAKIKKAIEEKRKSYVQPLQDQVKTINDTYKKFMEPIMAADEITRKQILNWNMEQTRIRQEQEEINRKRLEAAEQEMRLKGELSQPTEIVEVTAAPVKKISTDMGTSSMRDNWKFEIVDPILVPREYLVVDTAQLTAIARRHHDQKPIPGIRFYNEPVMNVRAR